jgi:ABC-type uncharacterized transport system substrate-binding protein
MRSSPNSTLSTFAITAILITQPPGAVAHPHVWVRVETTVLYGEGNFTGLKEKWTFDEFYTAYAIESLDKKHYGTYSRDELFDLAKINISALGELGYFTYPVVGGKEIKLSAAQDYWLEHKDGVLSLHFTVLFEQPILTGAKDFGFAVEDPTYFIAFVPPKSNAVTFGEGTPSSCKALIGSKDNNADTERLARAFAHVATPISVGNAVTIECVDR